MFEVFSNYLKDRISLSEGQLAYIESLSTIRSLRKKQYLLQEGDIWKYNAFVCKGCCRLYYLDEKGLEHILHFAPENWWTGDRESLSSGSPSRFNIDALEASSVLLISQEHFELIKENIPAFKDMVNDILQRSFIVSQNRIQAGISYTAEEKYKNFLNSYPDISNRVPQHMIASYLGFSPETLSRIRTQIAHR